MFGIKNSALNILKHKQIYFFIWDFCSYLRSYRGFVKFQNWWVSIFLGNTVRFWNSMTGSTLKCNNAWPVHAHFKTTSFFLSSVERELAKSWSIFFVHLLVRNVMEIFWFAMLCNSSCSQCYVYLLVRNVMYIFWFAMICISSGSQCYIILLVHNVIYIFWFAMLCKSSGSQCYVYLLVRNAMHIF